MDDQLLARHLIAGSVVRSSQNVDLIFERREALHEVEMKFSLAANIHRRIGLGICLLRRRRRCQRCSGRRAGGRIIGHRRGQIGAPGRRDRHCRRLFLGGLLRGAGRGFVVAMPLVHRHQAAAASGHEPHLNVVQEIDRLDAADAWAMFASVSGGKKVDLQVAAVARVLSEAKFDRLGGPNRFGVHLDILRRDENIVCAAGPAGRSANRDRPVKLRPSNRPIFPFCKSSG